MYYGLQFVRLSTVCTLNEKAIKKVQVLQLYPDRLIKTLEFENDENSRFLDRFRNGNFKLFLFFLTFFVSPICFNEFLSLLNVAWVNRILYCIVLYCTVLYTLVRIT